MSAITRLLRWAADKQIRAGQFNSAQYWENRYAKRGTSGAGSYGHLAQFKADFLNSFVKNNSIGSVIELGCGDGNQLRFAEYPSYFGYDVSETAIMKCRKLYANDFTKTFDTHLPQKKQFDLSLSLDVIFHLIEDEIFERYMKNLFSLSTRFAIIYSSNLSQSDFDKKYGDKTAQHVKHRCFTDWISLNEKNWKIIETKKNPYQFDPLRPNETSFSDFYVLMRD